MLGLCSSGVCTAWSINPVTEPAAADILYSWILLCQTSEESYTTVSQRLICHTRGTETSSYNKRKGSEYKTNWELTHNHRFYPVVTTAIYFSTSLQPRKIKNSRMKTWHSGRCSLSLKLDMAIWCKPASQNLFGVDFTLSCVEFVPFLPSLVIQEKPLTRHNMWFPAALRSV